MNILPSIRTDDGGFALIQLDQVESVAAQFNFNLETEQGQTQLSAWKDLVINQLSDQASGVLVDPVSGFSAVPDIAAETGVLFRLEKIGHGKQLPLPPRLLPNWGVEFVKNNFGISKIEMWYHPREEKALEKKQFIAELSEYCRFEDVELCLVLRIYDPEQPEVAHAIPQNHPTDQLMAARELSPLVSLIALEYPDQPLHAATLTAELDTPWVLVNERFPEQYRQEQHPGGVYARYKQQLRDALESGADGFLAGSVLWADLHEFRDDDMTFRWDKVQQFLETTARDRVVELQRIVSER